MKPTKPLVLHFIVPTFRRKALCQRMLSSMLRSWRQYAARDVVEPLFSALRLDVRVDLGDAMRPGESYDPRAGVSFAMPDFTVRLTEVRGGRSIFAANLTAGLKTARREAAVEKDYAHAYGFLADDMVCCDDFFERLDALWCKSEKMCWDGVSLHTDHRDACWNRGHGPWEADGSRYVDWTDGAVLLAGRTLGAAKWTFQSQARLHQSKVGTGIWADFSRRADVRLVQPRESLVMHDDDGVSVLNPLAADRVDGTGTHAISTRGPVRFTVTDLGTMVHPRSDLIARVHAADAVYERPLLERIREWVCENKREGAFALDVGAHVGNHSAWFARQCKLQVIAIEPHPELAQALRMNVPEARVIQAAAKPHGGRILWGRLEDTEPDNSGMSQVHLAGVPDDLGNIPLVDPAPYLRGLDLAVVKIDAEQPSHELTGSIYDDLRAYAEDVDPPAKPVLFAIERVKGEMPFALWRQATAVVMPGSESRVRHLGTFGRTPVDLFEVRL